MLRYPIQQYMTEELVKRSPPRRKVVIDGVRATFRQHWFILASKHNSPSNYRFRVRLAVIRHFEQA